MILSMVSHRTVALLAAVVGLAALSGCTTGGSGPGSSTDATDSATPQAAISGEWVVTRTVVSSDDATNPARAVGATSVRYVLIERDDCGDALCAGTVSTGTTPDARESTPLTQTDGGLEYALAGILDCMNAATGGVLATGGFDYEQTATLSVGEQADVDGVDTASTLAGTLRYSDTLTERGLENGCVRSPSTVTVEYSLSAVRAPA